MSNNRSRGTLQVLSNEPIEINQAFRDVREELDQIQGLRGRASIHDRVRVSAPTQSLDAMNLQTGVKASAGRMTYGADFVKYTDENGTLIHGFGNI